VRVRERLNPESITTRHRKAVADRCVSLTDIRDGMSFLDLLLPSAHAHAIFDRLTGFAIGLRTREDGRIALSYVPTSPPTSSSAASPRPAPATASPRPCTSPRR
jgi:hypothetical protein